MWFYDFSGKTNPPKRLRASQRRVEWKAVTEPRPKEAVALFFGLCGQTNPPNVCAPCKGALNGKQSPSRGREEAVGLVFRISWANEPTEFGRASQTRVERKAVTEPRPKEAVKILRVIEPTM
jgi:hypothetical protein